MTPREEYLHKKNNFKSSCVAGFITALIPIVPTIAVVWASIASGKTFFILFSLVCGIAIIVITGKSLLPPIMKSYDEMLAAKEAFFQSLEGTKDMDIIKRKKLRIRIIVITSVCVIIAGLITGHILRSARIDSVYSSAEAHIAEGKYEKAESELKSLREENYKDTESLLLLCRAYISYNDGNLITAHSSVKDISFNYQSGENLTTINAFINKVCDEYDARMEELARINKELYEKKITEGVPFVGMSESRISDTSLGSPSPKVRHNYQVKNGNQ